MDYRADISIVSSPPCLLKNWRLAELINETPRYGMALTGPNHAGSARPRGHNTEKPAPRRSPGFPSS